MFWNRKATKETHEEIASIDANNKQRERERDVQEKMLKRSIARLNRLVQSAAIDDRLESIADTLAGGRK